jgi:peroxiredoxin
MSLEQLPADLPVPVDDGGGDHLPGSVVPSVSLPATDGTTVDLARIGRPRAIVYVYPMTGRPGVATPAGWDQIPGARGCTPESCGFRDHHDDLARLGAEVFGLSTQDTEYQREAANRLRLPYPLLSDAELVLASRLGLPTFTAGSMRLYKRLTLVIRGGTVEHAFYPVFPPDRHAEQVLDWLGDQHRAQAT